MLSEFREKVISSKAAKEHIESKLNQQIIMLKDQSLAEEFQWKGKEELLNQELNGLKEKCGNYLSLLQIL